jgi:formate hydrogenlyase subunit 3/multisubunit Na+/H+ antiporter MnhD subunit
MIWLLPVGLIVYSYFEIKTGLPRIAALAPSGIAGGISAALWVSLFVEILITCLLLAVPLIGRAFPEAVHFGWRRLSDYTPSQRERIMPLLRRMVGLLGASCTFFSGFGIHMRIQAALVNPRHGQPNLWWVAGILVSFAAITSYYLRRFDEEAGEE